jgi:hypothetical protein
MPKFAWASRRTISSVALSQGWRRTDEFVCESSSVLPSCRRGRPRVAYFAVFWERGEIDEEGRFGKGKIKGERSRAPRCAYRL